MDHGFDDRVTSWTDLPESIRPQQTSQQAIAVDEEPDRRSHPDVNNQETHALCDSCDSCHVTHCMSLYVTFVCLTDSWYIVTIVQSSLV